MLTLTQPRAESGFQRFCQSPRYSTDRFQIDLSAFVPLGKEKWGIIASAFGFGLLFGEAGVHFRGIDELVLHLPPYGGKGAKPSW